MNPNFFVSVVKKLQPEQTARFTDRQGKIVAYPHSKTITWVGSQMEHQERWMNAGVQMGANNMIVIKKTCALPKMH